MFVYRLTKKEFQSLSGRGAELYGGRWNSKGNPMVYTSSSKALAHTECLVHLFTDILPDFVMLTIEIPDPGEIQEVCKLPKNWNVNPPDCGTKNIGDHFLIENKHLVMKVPSAVVEGEFNYMLNPLHEDMAKVKIIASNPFSFDERIASLLK